MSVFVDTSGLYAVVDADDRFSRVATRAWRAFAESGETLISTNYVLLETYSLLQPRLGMEAVTAIHDGFRPALQVIWIDRELHEASVSRLIREARRRVSLVDQTSFAVMRREGLRDAFTFDPHFADAGFTVVPGPA